MPTNIFTKGVRRVTKVSTIVNDYNIPAGTTVATQITAIGLDNAYWPDASSFIPERWIEPYKGIEADRKAFLPFSGGSRSCPGQYFAIRELRLLFSTLFRKFEISLVPGQNHNMRGTAIAYLASRKYLIRIKPRTS
ncbi:cytochrome P450 [Colletotrichum tofieldiae]|nr:cytochrome P450 [Colletotrichum tofieldiae]